MSNHYILLIDDEYVLYNKENLKYLAREYIAAKAKLTESDFEMLEWLDPDEYQDWMDHYFQNGQKVIVGAGDNADN